MGIILVTIILLVIILKIIQNKLIIRFDTFFRKGFTKPNDIYGIRMFVGDQGTGKTYSICDYIEELRKKFDLKVITNVKSYYLSHKETTIYNPNLYSIIELFNKGVYTSDYIIFYDEIFSCIEKNRLPKQVRTFICQLRKRHLFVVSSCQEWLDLDVSFRRFCRYIIDCNMFNLPFFKCAISTNVIKNGYAIKWDNLQNEYIAPIIKTTLKKCSKKIADAYDTDEVIEEAVAPRVGATPTLQKRRFS